MPALYHTAFSTSLGWMRPVSDGTALIRLDWEQSAWPEDDQTDNVSRETKRQILEYLAGHRKGFDLPLAPEGKTASGYAWLTAMARIPYGVTMSYKAFAALAGKPSAPRAAGSACARNPIPIIYPCHRVVRSDGALGNYGGGDMTSPKDPANLGRKDWLIKLEQGNS
ncbi:MAG: methylated-DNA--[protein]-cysteine S-methyltransferase [Candidatus Puniceispirillum sp.]|jgi:methylated-DNA-[protein]-cysteine S-methyltransferase|uniref:methylated-DNA--[protein]-cysteine S-methyltransferase n=1 Tax=Candidatus Puniceispirillum sp. TaxID=2026719 RepID=UPI001EC743C8|nr:methylated-DNA--[protein]-cysteine S-methyltransferase [Candidatus Puniceispirillum sp.]MBT6415319.1 methylated-DNA--[protein]-cysteine S-methyltransferase [Candidatus Puniceispirillum sp.]MBT6567008.1 methylated-DNA--[protein]-cysteine S-methyltransferase [Candidatus Puniceispirillum sp.]